MKNCFDISNKELFVFRKIHGTGSLPPSFLATCVYCGLFWDLRLKWVDVSRSFMAVWGNCLVFFAFFFLGGGGSNLEVSTNSLCSERLVTWVITNKGKDEVSTEPSKKDQVE